MKTVVGIKSCIRDLNLGHHEVIRQTWGKHLGDVDLLFFVGRKDKEEFVAAAQADEIVLDVDDSYDALPQKTKAILEFVHGLSYDFCFLCDTDTYIIPERLMRSGFENYDMAGRFGTVHAPGTQFRYIDGRGKYPNLWAYPSGGLGYFLSRRAMQDVYMAEPAVWAEDMYVGQVLGPMVAAKQRSGYDIPEMECSMSWHFPKRAYRQQSYDLKFGWMERMYQEHR